MKRFMIRVELHNARLVAQYEQLHALLARQGFINEIVSSTGQRYRLPPAEYCHVGDTTHGQVLATAKQCANQVDRDNAVVVTEATVTTWDGLQMVA